MELSAKEIVDLLLKGKKIKMKFKTLRDFQLFNTNLQVEKSRKRAAHVDFGLDFENRIIKALPNLIPATEKKSTLDFAFETEFTFFCTEPTPPKKYAVFTIED